MALTKQSFGLLVTTMTHWWSPTLIRISGDASVAGQIKQRPDGLVEFLFPERLVLIANHQVSPPLGWPVPISRHPSKQDRKESADWLSRYTRTGFTFGGQAMRTTPRCMATFTSS